MTGRLARWSLGAALLLPILAPAAEISVKDIATRHIADWIKAHSPGRT